MALVENLLRGYAEKGVFQGFARVANRRSQANFHILWHRRQRFELCYSPAGNSLRFACILPRAPSASPLYRDFKLWLKARQSEQLPDHRRCDSGRLEIKPYNRDGNAALTVRSLDGDLTYATQKLIGLAHELYLEFLTGGLYFDWLVATFELDPDDPYRT